MERKGCSSGYGMGMRVNFAGVPAENSITVTKVAGGSTAAAADVSRRRKPVMKKDKGFLKKKRMSDSADPFVPPPLPPHIIDGWRLAFLFSKRLHKSDVSHVGRIVLPKKPTEARLPVLLDNDSMILAMNDMNGATVWSFKFRYWPNNQSRMYVLEGTGEFTKKHRLEAGDYMLLYHDLVNHNHVIRGVRAYRVEDCENKEQTGVKDDELTNQNQDMARKVELDAINIPDFPNMEKGMSLMNDDIYFSDILNSFGSWDDFMTNNYPPTQQITYFENLSPEDLSMV